MKESKTLSAKSSNLSKSKTADALGSKARNKSGKSGSTSGGRQFPPWSDPKQNDSLQISHLDTKDAREDSKNLVSVDLNNSKVSSDVTKTKDGEAEGEDEWESKQDNSKAFYEGARKPPNDAGATNVTIENDDESNENEGASSAAKSQKLRTKNELKLGRDKNPVASKKSRAFTMRTTSTAVAKEDVVPEQPTFPNDDDTKFDTKKLSYQRVKEGQAGDHDKGSSIRVQRNSTKLPGQMGSESQGLEKIKSTSTFSRTKVCTF